MQTLTRRQSEVLKFITNFIRENDYSPSCREIAEGVGLSSPATVHQHLQALRQKGYMDEEGEIITRNRLEDQFMARVRGFELPLAGLITAGAPIEAVEEKETMSVPETFVQDENSFVLKVKGDSMIEEGILSGDYVIVEKKNTARDGEIVVALIDGENATLKRFYREKNRIRLQPANSSMEPIYAQDVQIQGVVKGVIRKFS